MFFACFYFFCPILSDDYKGEESLLPCDSKGEDSLHSMLNNMVTSTDSMIDSRIKVKQHGNKKSSKCNLTCCQVFLHIKPFSVIPTHALTHF